MLNHGTFAIAVVKRQVMVVEAARTHTKRDKYLDVHPYAQFGEGVFLATEVPSERIKSSDVLSVFSENDEAHIPTQGMLELPKQAFARYLEFTSRHKTGFENMWNAWAARR